MNGYRQSEHDGWGNEELRSNRRRNIAEIMSTSELSKHTLLARFQEKSRIHHLKQKRYQEVDIQTQEFIKASDPKLKLNRISPYATEESLVFGRDPLTNQVCLNPKIDGSIPTGCVGSGNEPILVHRGLSEALKSHQIVGARFIWSHIGLDNEYGCILADFMGLGKTLQVIAVIHSFLNLEYPGKNQSQLFTKRFKHVLVLAPAICVRNWQCEFNKWFKESEVKSLGVFILEADTSPDVDTRIIELRRWRKHGGVMIMGYEIFRTLILFAVAEIESSTFKKKKADEILKYLGNPGADLVVLDEGHRVRDKNSKLVKALNEVRTGRRIVLTGYPLQNHLKEYLTMVNFARESLLGTESEFANRFANPIQNGQCIDSNYDDVVLARKRAFVLTEELKSVVLRRNQQFLKAQLPEKKEWVIVCKLSPVQAKLYRAFLRDGRIDKDGSNHQKPVRQKNDILVAYHLSLAIANHPDVLYHTYTKSIDGELPKTLFQEDDDDFDSEIEDIFDGIPTSFEQKTKTSNSFNRSEVLSDDEIEVLGSVSHADDDRLAFAKPIFLNYEPGKIDSSGKMIILLDILEHCSKIGDRVIVFSQSVQTLNVISNCIACYNRRENGKKKKIFFERIDGSTSQAERRRIIDNFNNSQVEIDAVLVSTKAGGEGVNLCGGNRVVMFDVCWNPSHDSQSMCRAYRFGQQKPVHIYRLLSGGTMEKKVYELQIRKEGMSKRIVDDSAQKRRYYLRDLQNYFDIHEFKRAQRAVMFNPQNDPVEDKVLLQELCIQSTDFNRKSVQNDPILSSVLKSHEKWLVDNYQQESMFEEDESENCPEDQKALAIKDYEKEMHYSECINDGGVTCCKCKQKIVINHTNIVRMTQTGDVKCPHCKHNNYLNDIVSLEPHDSPTQPKAKRTRLGSRIISSGKGVNKKNEVETGLLTNRRIFMINRGIKNKDELRELAEKHGAQFDVELTPYTTDLISAWDLSKVMSWLNLSRLPGHIQYRRPEWLEGLKTVEPNLPTEMKVSEEAKTSNVYNNCDSKNLGHLEHDKSVVTKAIVDIVSPNANLHYEENKKSKMDHLDAASNEDDVEFIL